VLPDDVLLKMFDFHVTEYFRPCEKQRIEWITLAHVCRRWRTVVFQSPQRLNLQLLCTPKTPARDSLNIWPHFPLIVSVAHHIFEDKPSSVDNIIAALEHNDRVCQIKLEYRTSSQFQHVTNSAAMQNPFPELTDLRLGEFVYAGLESILPNSFLGGTAPRLRSLSLYHVPFPGLPKLLLSATHLVNLDLDGIPRSGYIPPEAMATSLSALTNLESFYLEFRYPRPRALESRRPPPRPLTRSILPNLTKIRFKGASEYLEEILARIDAPRVNELNITFFNQIIFDTPQLFQFISRRPTLRLQEKGHIVFNSKGALVKFPPRRSNYGVLSVLIPCTVSEWQVSSLEQVCSSSLPPLSTLKDLYIFDDRGHPLNGQGDVENAQWSDLLRPFVAVENLYLCKKFVPRIAPALRELVGGRTTEVLAALKNIFLEGPPRRPVWHLHEGIEKFVAARRLTNRSVFVSHWARDSKEAFFASRHAPEPEPASFLGLSSPFAVDDSDGDAFPGWTRPVPISDPWSPRHAETAVFVKRAAKVWANTRRGRE